MIVDFSGSSSASPESGLLRIRSGLIIGVVVTIICGVQLARAQYRFDQWTADNGLPQNSVYSILQTPDGYLWLTTLDGLVRFDGVRFTVFNKNNTRGLNDSRFIKLFSEADGTLWVCTADNGLVRYQRGIFQTFTTADGLPSNNINEVQKDLDGSLLITCGTGVVRFVDGRFTMARPQDFRDFKIYVSPAGRRWEMDDAGVRVYQDGRVNEYPLPFDPHRISTDRTFNYIFHVQMLEDREGALWLTAAGNLYRIKDRSVAVFTNKDGVPKSRIRYLLQDRQGAIWMGTEKDGACRFSQNHVVCFNTTNGLQSNNIMQIAEDREGTLWFGTNEGGLTRATPQVVSSISTSQGLLDKNVYPILEDENGGNWIGSFSALSYHKDGKIRNYTRRNGLIYEIVQALALDPDGRLWIGSVGGVEYLDKGKFTDFTQQLGVRVGESNFWHIYRSADGVLWFATSIGAMKYQNGAVTRITVREGLPNNDVKFIHESKDGSIWFATYGGVAQLKDGRIRSFTEKDGLASNHVRMIYEDSQGVFWFGTYDGGLSRWRDGKFINYTTDNGLYSNGVFQILEDARHNFWMTSNQGIYRVNRQQLEDFADGKLAAITSTSFGRSDGMLTMECNGGRQPSGIKSRDGRLWFPTQNGVAIIDPEIVPHNPLPPPVIIEAATLKGLGVPLSNELRLEPGQDSLEIRYTGLSFIKPENLRFRYRLEGLSHEWTEAGTRRTAYFPYLPPGEYTFRVIAANSDGIWNVEGQRLRIVVLPPFYRRWWFLLLSGVAIVGGIVLTFQYRVRRLERQQRAQQEFSQQLIESQETERQRIAAELHDSLGQNLIVIKSWATLGLTFTESDAPVREQLSEISTVAVQSLNDVRAIIHNLRPYQLDTIGLNNALRFMAEQVGASSGVKFKIEIDQLENLFSPEAEVLIFRIVQECINNIIKHAQATEAKLQVKIANGNLHLIISDNGRGFNLDPDPQERPRGGWGLTGINERVRILRGTHKVTSNPGAGTTHLIVIPHPAVSSGVRKKENDQ